MNKVVLAFAGAFMALASSSAYAAPSITVTPTLAPNAFGSPNYAAWVDNSVFAQLHGQSTAGFANSPTLYTAQSNVGAAEGIVTGFNSWKGQANPGAVFGPQYANELGNRMLFGLFINGNGAKISIDQVGFSATSNDPGNALGFGFATGSYNYSLDYRGIIAGSDGILGTVDDIVITSGPASQLVDAIVGRGSGNSFAAYCTGCTTAQEQAAIDSAASYWNQFGGGTFTGTYTYGQVSGSNTFNIRAMVTGAVPEPATWMTMLLGFGAVGGMLRRKRRTPNQRIRFA